MKQNVNMSRSINFLEKAFRALNNRYFEGRLEEPIITVQSTPRAYGHVTVGKTWKRGEETRHELNLGAGTLDRPTEDLIATLLHEMVHLWNLQNGIKDCSRAGIYHNKKFRYAAEARDLHIDYDSRIGWSITSPTPALCDFIIEQGWQDILINRIEFPYTPRGTGGGDANGPAATGTAGGSNNHHRKYQCPCCKASVRATKIVHIKCADCDEMMQEV